MQTYTIKGDAHLILEVYDHKGNLITEIRIGSFFHGRLAGVSLEPVEITDPTLTVDHGLYLETGKALKVPGISSRLYIGFFVSAKSFEQVVKIKLINVFEIIISPKTTTVKLIAVKKNELPTL